MLEFLCPNCHKRLRVDEGLAGKQGRCPACRGTITIPEPSQALKPAAPTGRPQEDDMPLPTEVLLSPETGPPKTGAPQGPRPPAPAAVNRPAPAVPSASAPAAVPPRSAGSRLWLVVIPIVVILAGIAAYYFFCR